MKKSTTVLLTVLSSLSVFLTGCDDSSSTQMEIQRCVDQKNVVVDESNCQNSDRMKAQYHNVAPSPVPSWWYYHWYFGGTGHYPGSYAYGGSMYPTPGISSVRSSVVSRGGFGSIGGGRVSVSSAGE